MSLSSATNSQSDDEGSKTLRFAYRSMRFSVAVTPFDGGTMLDLTGELGIMPFTGHGANRRRDMNAVFAAVRRLPDLRLYRGTRQEIILRARVSTQAPGTRAQVLAELIRYMAKIKPILDVIASLQPPAFAPVERQSLRRAC